MLKENAWGLISMLISMMISSINSASSVIITSVIITVVINSIGIVTKKTMRIIITVIHFPVVSAHSAEAKTTTASENTHPADRDGQRGPALYCFCKSQ